MPSNRNSKKKKKEVGRKENKINPICLHLNRIFKTAGKKKEDRNRNAHPSQQNVSI